MALGYVPAATETDPQKIARSVRNLHENAVGGPASATNGNIPLFDSSGNNASRLLKDSGVSITTTGATTTGGSFFAYLSANQTGCTSSAFNKVNLNTALFDNNNWFDSATNHRYVPLLAGKYFFTCTVQTNGGTGGESPQPAIYKNGSVVQFGPYVGSGLGTGGLIFQASTIVSLNGSTDYVELYCWVPAAITVIAGVDAYRTNLMGYYIST